MSQSGTIVRAPGSQTEKENSGQALPVTLIGSLPPIKGVSPYTNGLLTALAGRVDLRIEFLGFRSIYPRWVYPGGDPVDRSQPPTELPRVAIRNVLTWYNPWSWVWAGLSLKGEVIHAQWWSYILAPVYATVLAIARLKGKRVVLTLHNVDPHEQQWWKVALNRAIFSFGHRFIVHSDGNRESLEQRYKKPASAISVVPHGLLAPTSSENMTQAEARSRLGVPAEGPIVLHFGNIRPYKGLDDLLRAFAKVLDACPSALLIIAGKPWTDWRPFDRLIDELELRPRVRLFLDFVSESDVEPLFVAADIVVLPYTHFDAQSGVGALALSFRKPMVVTSTGGLPDLVADPSVIVPPKEPTALGEAITRVLTDDALRRRLEADSLATAARFDWGRIADQTVSVYRNLATRSERDRSPSETPK